MDPEADLAQAVERFSSAIDQTARGISAILGSLGPLTAAVRQVVALEQQFTDVDLAQHPDMAELNVFLDAVYDVP